MTLRALPAALALMLVLPAAFAATLTDAGKLNQLQPGKTSAPQAVEALGKPNQENRSPDGRFAYMYEFSLPNKADPSQPAVQGVAALMFSKDGVLQGMEMFKKADGAK
jgi:hypothetical protein